jgi:hypothetical protein
VGRGNEPDERMIWIVVGVAIVAAGVVMFVLSRRRAPDGVTSFQRQIDALSPEARRSVVDRVQQLEEGSPDGDDGTDGT